MEENTNSSTHLVSDEGYVDSRLGEGSCQNVSTLFTINIKKRSCYIIVKIKTKPIIKSYCSL